MSLTTYLNPDAIENNTIERRHLNIGYTFDGSGKLTFGSESGIEFEICDDANVPVPGGKVHMGSNVTVGKDVEIGAGVCIGTGSESNFESNSNVFISENVYIGITDGNHTGVNIGTNVKIGNEVEIGKFGNTEVGKVTIGTNVEINSDVHIGCKIEQKDYIASTIYIGTGVRIGAGVKMFDTLQFSTSIINDEYYLNVSWEEQKENGENIIKEMYLNNTPEITIDGDRDGELVLTLSPNIYYNITNATSANISFGDGFSNVMKNYMFQIDVVGSNPEIELPSTIKWANGNDPFFVAGKTYQISVINNLGVFTEF